MRQIQFSNAEAVRELQAMGFPIDPELIHPDLFSGWLIDDHVFVGRRTGDDGEEEPWRVSLYPWGMAVSCFFDDEGNALAYAAEVAALKLDWSRLVALPDAVNNPEYRDALQKLQNILGAWFGQEDDCVLYGVPDDQEEVLCRLS